MDTNAIVINYWDNEVHTERCSATITLTSDSTERGVSYLLEKDEQFLATITIPQSANITAYETFTFQLLPPKGEPVTITKTLPGTLLKVIDLH